MGRVRHSREQWLLWVVEQRSSEMTVAAFCDSVGIKENSFYRWRAKLLAEGESLEDPQTVAVRQASAFVPLSIVAADRIEIDLPCGATVRVPSDEGAIRCVLSVLLDVDRVEPREGGTRC